MKKILISLTLSLTLVIPSLFFLSAKPTYAASGLQCLIPTNTISCLTGGANPFTWTKDQLFAIASTIVEAIIHTLSIAIAGDHVVQFVPSLGLDNRPPSSSEIIQHYGILGFMGAGMASMYTNPPITIQDYLATIHPITQAYAVRTDVPGIYGDVIRNFWTASRNIAYGLFVIVLVVIGLMLMLRTKLNPKTTVTVTAAIPGLIVSLVLITFSLALAGLMVNLGQLIQEIIKNILTTNAITQAPLLPDPATQKTGFGITDIFIQFVNPFAGTNAVSLGGQFNGGLASVFLDFVIIIFAFILALNVFIMLLVRFLYILIKPIAAPLIFLFGAIPGRSGATISWFKGYLVDVLTFPLVLLLINLGVALRHTSGTAGGNGDPFGLVDPGANLAPLLSIGMLLIATKVPAFLEEILDVKESPYVGQRGAKPESMLKRVPFVGGLMK